MEATPTKTDELTQAIREFRKAAHKLERIATARYEAAEAVREAIEWIDEPTAQDRREADRLDGESARLDLLMAIAGDALCGMEAL